jgi:iron complex outermembrane receptor protein
MNRLFSALLAAAGMAFVSTAVFADTATLEGKVTGPDGAPAADVRVLLVELHRTAFSDAEGHYAFSGIEPDYYHVQAVGAGIGSSVAEITLAAGENQLDLELNISPHQERIVVSATRSGRGSAELVQPVTVLDKTELGNKMQPTLGETLAREPGLSQTFYGTGSSRPIVRGQSASRVRVLEGGLGVGDASAASPDHAVSSDALVAEQVEILRGPATLLYGSTAVGGVVNVIDGRIPDHAPKKPIGGDLQLSYGSAAEETAAALSLDGGTGQFAWHVDALQRDSEDYEFAGNAIVGDPGSASGTLPNSAREADGATVGLAWVGDESFAGVSFRKFDTLYGIPVVLEDEAISIDMEQQRYDLRSDFHVHWGFVEEIQFTAGATDYEHTELEGTEAGTRFLVESREGRLELHHRETGLLTGVLGVQHTEKDQEAIGEEAFLPPSNTSQSALFALERFDAGPVDLELGLRLERSELEALGAPSRDFDGVSGSAGLLWMPNQDYAVGLSLTRAERAPTAEELYSDGPHLATSSFEIGDPDLSMEESTGIDLSLRKQQGRITGEVTLFANDYDGFIFETPTGAIMDELPVFQFVQDDADFHGIELDTLIGLMHTETKHLDLRIFGDLVRAELDDGTPLPFIPSERLGVGIDYIDGAWEAGVELIATAEQDRVPDFVTETDSHTMVNASVGRRLVRNGLVHKLSLRGTNLTDEEARAATSRVKDLVPMPGRDLRVMYSLFF